MKIKNILCYVALVFLFALIIVPPVLRIVSSGEEVVEQNDKIISLNCSGNNRKIFVSYKNNNIYMFRYTITKTYNSDGLLEEIVGDSLKSSMEAVTNVQISDTYEEAEYEVLFDENGYNNNNFPSEYMQDSVSEESYLTSQGYTCTTFEQ